jgi:tetratricopeptide (TPR) repeat protein
MHRNSSKLFLLAAVVVLGATTWGACTNTVDEAKPASPAASASNGKIPITSSSEEAKKEFLQGRDLAEQLQAQNSLQPFDKAISLDPNFAYAELLRANASQSANEFFDHLGKAVKLADKASEGERLLILANEAGANGDTPKQKEYLDKLVAALPKDERAHFNLGGYYFGQQNYTEAIKHYKEATVLAPNYSPVFNILGYAYRQNGDFANAEQAFKKYIELIPNDPNPYDSYGELLLKMGKFDDSIAQYRKALSIDPTFVPSHVGIATAMMYQGKPADATAELKIITDKARNDGERRTALFTQAVVDADSGKLDAAIADIDKQFAIGEKNNDSAQMAGDLQVKGAILLAMGKADEGKAQFDRLLDITEKSNLSKEIKDNAKDFHHFNLAAVAIAKKDLATAKTEAEEFRKSAEASKNPALVQLSHEMAGRIALAENDYDKAIAELQQSSLLDPQNLYRIAEAYKGKGDAAKTKEFAAKAADFNGLPQITHGFIRTKAKQLAA